MRSRDVILETYDDDQRTTKSITLRGEAGWWEAAIGQLIREATQPGLGNRALLGRLSELLFLDVLRWQLSCATDARHGWLAGLNDPQVGKALTLLHAEPARPWTVEELAKRVAISRAGLAKRFVDLVGETPMQYLTGWRMHLARRLLIESPLGLAEIASRVGYDSEAAFNRAFRRVAGVPPASWRKTKASAGHTEDEPMDRDTATRDSRIQPLVSTDAGEFVATPLD